MTLKLPSNEDVVCNFITSNCYFMPVLRSPFKKILDSYIYCRFLQSMKDNFVNDNDIDDKEIKDTDYDPCDLASWYISDSPGLCQDMSSSEVECWTNRLTAKFQKDEYKSVLLAIKEEILLIPVNE